MLKMYTAFTKEIDSPEDAVREILEQLKPAENILKNAIGIVQFYHEFVETGVYKAVAEALPFELVGCVTLFSGARDGHGDFAMTVTMLTSDDVDFSVKTVNTNIQEKKRERITEAVVRIGGEFCEKENPKMVMAFLAFEDQFTGDDLVAAIDSLPKPFPLFGTIAFSDTQKPSTNMVVKRAETSHKMSVFVAFYGNIAPVFRVTTALSYEESIGDSTVTEADGPVLKKVDGMDAVDFLKKQGILNADGDVSISTWIVPAVLTYPNGVKVVRAFMGKVPGTNHVFATGLVNEGLKIAFANLDGPKTLLSAEKLFEDICEKKENDTIAFICAARLWALGASFGGEAERIASVAEKHEKSGGAALNYSLACSGGEFCPIRDNDGEHVNALHNYTLITCTFN